MRFTLRDYQQAAVDHAAEWAATAREGDKLLLASPTGTGKSLMELATLERLSSWWIVTPKVEILAGMLDKLGVRCGNEAETIRAAWDRRITTPIRLRAALLKGECAAPAGLIFDEGHHELAATWGDIGLLAGMAPMIAFSATPYRGTPKGTAAFRERWGEPQWVITYPEAASRGDIAIPTVRTLALVDDDEIEVRNGELVANQVDSAYSDRLPALAAECAAWRDRPTLLCFPSRATARLFLSLCNVPVRFVDGETSYADRQAAFAACLASDAILAHVDVISEGVDLPIRRLVDAAPCLSPVKWLQRLGRVMRPIKSELPPEYVCTNRNLLRHGYLLEGCLPPGVFKQSQEEFGGKPGKRAASRVIGLEAIGRLKAVELPLRDGSTGLCYSMSAVNGFRVTEYFVAVRPDQLEPLWARREYVRLGDGRTSYGRWTRCDPPNDVQGFASLPPRPVSEKQAAWWKRDAARHGLNPDVEVTRKVFPALPVLADLRAKL